jgi:aminoglycoside N3'-acetyltransferase
VNAISLIDRTETTMSPQPIRNSELTAQILELGVTPGAVLLVHTSFSRVSPVEGGPRGLIGALLAALGPNGTLVMPSMSDDDDHPFDPRRTPCLGMGVVADTFWRTPNVLRSDSPHAFAAIGPEPPLSLPTIRWTCRTAWIVLSAVSTNSMGRS